MSEIEGKVVVITGACSGIGKATALLLAGRGLVNNAGISSISALDDLRVEDWEDMIDVNLKGDLYGIAAALPVFRAQGLRQEAGAKLRVTAISPGFVQTGLADSMTDAQVRAQGHKRAWSRWRSRRRPSPSQSNSPTMSTSERSSSAPQHRPDRKT